MEKEIQKKLNLNVPPTENTEKRDQLVAMAYSGCYMTVWLGGQKPCVKNLLHIQLTASLNECVILRLVSKSTASYFKSQENDVLQQISSPAMWKIGHAAAHPTIRRDEQ